MNHRGRHRIAVDQAQLSAPPEESIDLTVAALQRAIILRLRGVATTRETAREETDLVLAIIEQAVRDLWDPEHWISATNYLRRNPHRHAHLIGIDAEWMRRTIVRMSRASGQSPIADCIENGPPVTVHRYAQEQPA